MADGKKEIVGILPDGSIKHLHIYSSDERKLRQYIFNHAINTNRAIWIKTTIDGTVYEIADCVYKIIPDGKNN